MQSEESPFEKVSLPSVVPNQNLSGPHGMLKTFFLLNVQILYVIKPMHFVAEVWHDVY